MQYFNVEYKGRKYAVSHWGTGVSIFCHFKREGRFALSISCSRQLKESGALYKEILTAIQNKGLI